MSPSKKPDIKTPLVAKNEKQFPAKNSPVAAFWVLRRTRIINRLFWIQETSDTVRSRSNSIPPRSKILDENRPK